MALITVTFIATKIRLPSYGLTDCQYWWRLRRAVFNEDEAVGIKNALFWSSSPIKKRLVGLRDCTYSLRQQVHS